MNSHATDNRPTAITAQQLAAIWAEALGLDEVGLDDDFFELGGNSIMAIRLLPVLAERFGVEPCAGVLFEHPTPNAAAAALREQAPQS